MTDYGYVVVHETKDAAQGEVLAELLQNEGIAARFRGPATTAASFDAEGRFRTGDTGTRDADGVVRLLGRTSIDIIKSGGYKLSALEIEAVLLEHPAVAEVAVTGVPDATWGECVTAWVVARGAVPPTLPDLQSFARERLGPYKLPRALELVAALPRNAMGKVQNQRLRAPAAAQAQVGDGR